MRALSPRLFYVTAAAVVAALASSACSDDPHLRATGASLSPCAVAPGQMPAANCGDTAALDRETACHLAAICGDPQTCMPLASNDGDTLDFRLRRLNVVAPGAFASGPLADAFVTERVDLDATQCGESGTGLFNWLMRLDPQSGTLLTGGAPPTANAFTDGYCFASYHAAGKTIAPATAPVLFAPALGGRTFATTRATDLTIPVFHSSDPATAAVLTIRDVMFQDVSVSDDQNCIGSFNPAALDAACSDEGASAAKWNTAGALGGYMLLEDADAVTLTDLDDDSMCVALLGVTERDDTTHKCKRDSSGKLPAFGDYCSLTKSAGGCRDSVWFAATFAASAVKITGGASVKACTGASM